MSIASAGRSSSREIVIRPASEALRFDAREYYRARHMLAALVRRNIRIQFDQMYLGVLWAFVRPLLYVFVFVAFRKLSNANPQVAIPYPVYVYSGLILWYYFLESTTEAANAVKADAHLLTKVYYPRLITPAVPIIANLSGLVLSVIPLVLMMAWYGIVPGWRIVLVPVILVQCMGLIMGIGTIFASITLTNRDWERFLTFALYLGLFVSPVIYAPDMIPGWGRPAYFLNPMAGTLVAFRSSVFAAEPFPLLQWTYSLVFSVAVFALGVRTYRTAEAEFADQL